MNISLLNSPLLSWDGILDSKKCKDVSKIIQAIYLQYIYKVIHGLNNIELFLNNQMTI
jgi:hypothetical protein